MTNVSPHGFWLMVAGRELFVPFATFPWFREASIGQITSVEQPSAGHLHWPQLDVDLTVESIEDPDRYPLVARVRGDATAGPTGAAPTRSSPSQLLESRAEYHLDYRVARPNRFADAADPGKSTGGSKARRRTG